MAAKSTDIPLGRSMGLIAKRYIGIMYKRLSHLDIGANFLVLMLIDMTESTLTQQELADLSEMDKTNMVRTIDALQDKGLVEREQKPADRRAYVIKLTPNGKKTIPIIKKTTRTLNNKALHGLSESQVKSFYKILETISKNIALLPAEDFQVTLKNVKK
jgi:MarR family transcriptional regulator for hemolysin